jgi:hypothetical protein
MPKKLREVVIPKEQALFWLDKHGFWHNEHEKFQHRRIINHFHSSIRKDKDGFYLLQTHRDYREKVYFFYEDTALFVFDVLKQEEVILILNTKKRMKLKPKKLFVKNDNLYMDQGEDSIKFSEQALIRIANLLEYVEDQVFIRTGGRRYRVAQS